MFFLTKGMTWGKATLFFFFFWHALQEIEWERGDFDGMKDGDSFETEGIRQCCLGVHHRNMGAPCIS